jgi:hypothetical protein
MTLQEKVNQLLIPWDDVDVIKAKYGNTSFGAYYIDFVNADPNQRNQLQQFIVDNSRLHIPVAFVQVRFFACLCPLITFSG